MALLGKKIQLTGISQRGKNRVRDHGSVWHVLAETDHLLFSPSLAGPWLYVSPAGKNVADKSSRWIHRNNDPDFLLEVIDD